MPVSVTHASVSRHEWRLLSCYSVKPVILKRFDCQSVMVVAELYRVMQVIIGMRESGGYSPDARIRCSNYTTAMRAEVNRHQKDLTRGILKCRAAPATRGRPVEEVQCDFGRGERDFRGDLRELCRAGKVSATGVCLRQPMVDCSSGTKKRAGSPISLLSWPRRKYRSRRQLSGGVQACGRICRGSRL